MVYNQLKTLFDVFSDAVLAGCNVYGNADTGKLLANKILRVKVKSENIYLLLSTNV